MKNGYFQLEKRRDGTYLIIYPPQDMGEVCDPVEITRYLDTYRIDYSKNVVYDAVRSAVDKYEVRITTLQIGSIDESLVASMSQDGQQAVVRFYPPSTGGRDYSFDDIVFQLKRQGVKFGIKENEINRFLSDRQFCTDYVVAEAEPPEEGRDASIEYHFNIDLSRKPKMNDDGSVDFHQLDTVSLVHKGECLATLTPAIHGKPGTDVMGRPIKPRKVVVKFLRQIKNGKLSADGLELFSEVEGHAMLVDGQIFVSDTYQVPANVDASTGDITYNGNVEIQGNVNTGYRVEASGDVVVNGIVEGAEIVAGGQIILKRGIQGMGRGILNAGSNVVSRFIESAEVTAGGFVQTESIMHSTVTAAQEITVKGKKGFVTGGSIKSGKYIAAKTAGSVMGTNTILEVGINQKLAAQARQMEQERRELLENIDKSDKVIMFISKKLKTREQLSPDKLEQFQVLNARKKEMENRVQAITDELIVIHEELDNATGGYILVDDIIYPGCRVTVSNATTFIRNETKHCRLVRDGADVRVAGY